MRVIFDISALLLVICSSMIDLALSLTFGVVYGVFGRGCNANFGYLRYFASAIASGASDFCRTVASSTNYNVR